MWVKIIVVVVVVCYHCVALGFSPICRRHAHNHHLLFCNSGRNFADTELFINDLKRFLVTQPPSTLIPREIVLEMVKEVKMNEDFWKRSEPKFNEIWSEIEMKLRGESRTISDILGREASESLLISVENFDFYDTEGVKAFLFSPAIETMIGMILYEGIFEFIQRADIIGGVVNTLPVIGPIRVQIVNEFKKNIDRVLGGQVKTFLSSFNRVALQRMLEFILSEGNKESLAEVTFRDLFRRKSIQY